MDRIIRLFGNMYQHHPSPITIPLVLHRVVKDSPVLFDDVDEKTFLSIVRHIKEGWVVFGEGVGYRSGISRNWLLTFDDGYSSDYEIVFPILQDAGIRAVFFLITERVGSPGYLSWEHVREMRRHGMEFGSHGLTHAKLTMLDKRQVFNELTRSRQEIEDCLGEEVTAFSFPYGYYDADLIKLTESTGYKACCISDHGFVKLPAQVVPRNSINSSMRWTAVLRTLEPSLFVHLNWIMEDWTKKYVKNVLGDEAYKALRSLLKKGR